MSKKKLPAAKKIRKPSAMIQTNIRDLTLTQRKLINFMVFVAQREGDRKLYSTDVKTMKALCDVRSTENIDLREQFEQLNSIKIEFNYLGKDNNTIWELMNLVSAARVVTNTGQVDFEIPYMLREKILNPNIYTPLNILLIAGLKSKYSIILYELLRDYMTAPVFPKLSIDQFRVLMGLNDNQYKLFKDLRKRVIDRAVKEINKKTDIRCSYTLVKEHGNRYAYIVFEVEKNEDFKLPQAEKKKTLPPPVDEYDIPHDVLHVIPKKYRVAEVFRTIAPYLDRQAMLISNIRYTDKKHKENFIGYLRKALLEDYAKSAREVQENEARAAAEAEERAALETKRIEEEEKLAGAVITWRSQASPTLLRQIQDRAAWEVKEEYPEAGKNFLGIPVRIRTDEIIVNEYLSKPQEPEQEELVLFELEQNV